MKRILIVDDELQILRTLQRMFLETDYEILTTDSSKEALKLLDTSPFDMVISDMRMPEIDGYKLLSMVKEKYPKIIRIILSGYADEKPMFRALLHNVAKLYIFKPWNNSDFLQNINRLFADENELNSNRLREKLDEIYSSTNIPESCNNMINHIEEENIDALIEDIEQNPEVSKLLIQVAKSAIYGVMPNTVKQAAIYIGLHNLKSFLRYACVVNTLKLNVTDTDELDLLCKHSYYTSRIFLFLFEAFLHKQPPDSTLFAGLMHNIGLIILTNNKGDMNPALTLTQLAELEHGENEVIHQELGANFLDQWDLPFPMYEVALYHHRPLNPNIINQELVSCVHIAQAYAWKALGADFKPVDPEVFEGIGISVGDFEKRFARYMKL